MSNFRGFRQFLGRRARSRIPAISWKAHDRMGMEMEDSSFNSAFNQPAGGLPGEQRPKTPTSSFLADPNKPKDSNRKWSSVGNTLCEDSDDETLSLSSTESDSDIIGKKSDALQILEMAQCERMALKVLTSVKRVTHGAARRRVSIIDLGGNAETLPRDFATEKAIVQTRNAILQRR